MPERPSRLAFTVLTLTLMLGVCGCAKSGLGDACTTDSDCNETFVCIVAGEDAGRCMRTCEAGTRLCGDGLVCMTFGTQHACFLGGRVGYREACTSSFACEAGTVCPASLGLCTQACGTGLDVCRLVEVCIEDALVGAYCGPGE